jgi:ParB family chromosome partitioning protein
MEVVKLKISEVVLKDNSRGQIGDDLSELMSSIKTHGLLQPIGVIKSKRGKKYEVVYGNRRYNAVKKLGIKTIQAVILKVNDADKLILNLVENIQRKDVPVSEQARYIVAF